LNEIKIEKDRLDKEVQKYDNIVAILERMPNELSWQLPYLPVTNHALFPGTTLNNTNEVQVHIGDGWFTRCSAHHAIGICHRRQDSKYILFYIHTYKAYSTKYNIIHTYYHYYL
jgi:hypothetical protein